MTSKANDIDNGIDLTRTIPVLAQWRAAVKALEEAKALEEKLRAEFKATLTTLGVQAGYLVDSNGVKRQIVSCAPTKSFRGAEFKKARPDLAEQFEVPKMTYELDTDALKKQFPEVYKQFQTVALRPDWKQFDAICNSSTDEK